MTIYERYENGRLVPGSRQEPAPGRYDETRLGLLVLERRESGAVDGWYEDGEYAQVQARRAAVAAGTVTEVLAEVGDDPQRALAALRAETARDKPRKSLVAKLQEVAEPALAVDADSPDYDAMSEPQLDELLVQRGQSTSGNAAEKVMRLRAHDMEGTPMANRRDYQNMSDDEVRAEAGNRSLATDGAREDVEARLRDYDAQQAGTTTPGSEQG